MCEECGAVSWLTQDCETGVLKWWVRRSWDKSFDGDGWEWLKCAQGAMRSGGAIRIHVEGREKVQEFREVNGEWVWVSFGKVSSSNKEVNGEWDWVWIGKVSSSNKDQNADSKEMALEKK